MDKPKVQKNKKQENIKMRLSLLKSPGVSTCRRVCSVDTQLLLNQLKLKRETCCTRYSFYQVDKIAKTWIKKYHMQGRYAEAIVFMYEHASTALCMKDKNKALSRINRMQSYKKKHGVDCWLVDVGLNRALFFEACNKRNVQSIMKYLYEMKTLTKMTGSSLGLHMFNYAAGTFCLTLLKMDTEQAGDALDILHQFCSTKVTNSTVLDVYTPSQCFKRIQSIAFEHFRVAREALFRDRKSEDVSYFYNDPQEVLYPLLSMAKVKLFLPEFEHAASEGKKLALLNLLSAEDVAVAAECLTTFDKEKEQLQITPRLSGRYHITKAGLEFRKWQMDMKAQHQDHLCGNVTKTGLCTSSAISSVKNHSCLEMAIDYTSKAIENVRNTEFEELRIANRFHQYLLDFKNIVMRQETTKPATKVAHTSAEERAEQTESSENDLKDAVAFLNDLDEPADGVLSGSSIESDVNMDGSFPGAYGSEGTEDEKTMKELPVVQVRAICDGPPTIVVEKARPSGINYQFVNDMDLLQINDLGSRSSGDCSLSEAD